MKHPAGHELLLVTEDALPFFRAWRIRRHLRGCEPCRARQAEMEESLREVARLREDRFQSHAVARARLQAALPASSAAPAKRWRFAAATAAVAAAALWAFYPAPADHSMLPDSKLTPGAVTKVTAAAVCATPEQEPPPIDPVIARQVFQRYGIDNPQPRAFELDYLITPALGGAAEAANLWPQPYSAGPWNSRVKDALEDRLRSLVCQGKLELADAQQQLAKDWIAAYRRHFGADQPLMDHMAFVKDPAWE